MKEPAHVAYDAYGDFVGWKNFAGNPMPKWDELPEKIQNAWRAATRALNDRMELAEQLQVQLAGCGVAALGGMSSQQVAQPGDYGWSPSYADVLLLRRAFDLIANGASPEDVLRGRK